MTRSPAPSSRVSELEPQRDGSEELVDEESLAQLAVSLELNMYVPGS